MTQTLLKYFLRKKDNECVLDYTPDTIDCVSSVEKSTDFHRWLTQEDIKSFKLIPPEPYKTMSEFARDHMGNRSIGELILGCKF